MIAPRRKPEASRASELLKEIHDLGDIIAENQQLARLKTERRVLARECCQRDVYVEGKIGAIIRLSAVSADNLYPTDMMLLIGLPIGQRRQCHITQERPALYKPFALAALDQWGKDGECPVLVGIRELSYGPKGVVYRTWLSMERLEFPDFFETEANIAEAAIRQGAVLCSDTRFVTDFRLEDRELMLRRERGGRRSVNERRHDIVESGPQVVYEVADDSSERIFRSIVRANQGVTPAVFVDWSDPNGVSVAVLDERACLSLKRLQVFARPFDLCLRSREVEG